MKYFKEFTTDINEIRSQFRELCLKLHPDKGGSHEDFLQMKDEYEKIISRASATEGGKANRENRTADFTFEGEKEIMEMIEKLMNIGGIEIEVCGSWIWVGGNTFTVHEQLKEAGMKFSGKKKMWYWSAYLGSKKKRGRYSMNKIRSTYGSFEIGKTEERKVLA